MLEATFQKQKANDYKLQATCLKCMSSTLLKLSKKDTCIKSDYGILVTIHEHPLHVDQA